MADLLVEDRGPVRRLVLNRPQKRNALGHHLIEALLAEFARAERDDAVRVVVLAGAGAGFSAGADLGEARSAADEAAIAHHAGLMGSLLLAPSRLAKPVVAEVHGFALGAGFGLMLACDAAFCAEGTALAFPETRHGMVPALVAPPLLRRVGEARAFEILATGRTIPVAEAAALGLVRPVKWKNLPGNSPLLMLRCRPKAGLEARTTAVRPSRPPGQARGHLSMRRGGVSYRGSEAVRDEAMAFAERLAAAPGPIVAALKALLREVAGKDMPAAMEAAREANIAGKLRRLAEVRT